MPDITDPEIIRFTNEQVRPMAEILRALASRTAAVLDTYNVQIAPLITAAGHVAADPLLDGRESEGVSRLTLEAITDIVAILNTVDGFLSTVANVDAITLPTVRTPGSNVTL